ncbi:unnamed protein product [Heligmosomoides polygyrus]|uniref:Apple domain-containing protein n=1 Tax=Heligmosomoides polygyrus TaxID=6339 RepID=A0A183FE05_HELPZ|nr:unnamed protein product [Heligmosomoides polygyrus]
MLRWACGWTLRDRVRNEDVRAVVKTDPIQLKMREQRLRWFGHILRRPEDHPTRLALDFDAPGKRPRGAPRKRWKEVIKRDLAEVGATADDALDSAAYKVVKLLLKAMSSAFLNTVKVVFFWLACSAELAPPQEDDNNFFKSPVDECGTNTFEWSTKCYIPSTDWAQKFRQNEGEAMKGCKDACITKDVTDLMKKNAMKFSMQKCYVRCPCLDLDFCDNAAFANVACPADMASEDPGTCSTSNKQPARAASAYLPKSSSEMATTEESILSSYAQHSTSNMPSSEVPGRDTDVITSQSSGLLTSAGLGAAWQLASNVRTTSSDPLTSKGLEHSVKFSLKVYFGSTTRYTGKEKQTKERSTVTETTLYSMESSETLSPQTSTIVSTTVSSNDLEYFEASRITDTSAVSRSSSTTATATSVFTVPNTVYDSYSPSTTSQPVSMSTSVEPTLSKRESTTLKFFPSTFSNERIEESSSSTSDFKEIASAVTPSESTSTAYTVSTLEGSQSSKLTLRTSSEQASAISESFAKVVQSSSTEATTGGEHSSTTAPMLPSTAEAAADESENGTLPFFQNFTTFEAMSAISSGTMTTAEYERTPSATASLRPQDDAQTTETSPPGKTSVPESHDATTTWHPKRLTPVPAFGHFTSIASTEEHAKTSPAAKVTPTATRPSQPSTTRLPTLTDQSDTVETTSEEGADPTTLGQHAQLTTATIQTSADATTSTSNVWIVTNENTIWEQPSSSSSSDPSPCPPQYHEGPSNCYRFTPPSANTYRKVSRFQLSLLTSRA